MRESKITKWQIAAIVLLVLQFLTGTIAIIELCILNMLPDIYLFTIIMVLIFWFIISGNFDLIANTIKDRNPKRAKRLAITGYVLSVLATIVSVVIAIYIGKLNHTVSSISDQTATSNVVSVYVMEESPYWELLDAKDDTFAITKQFDYENTQLTIENMQEVLEQEVSTSTYDAVTDMVDALFRREVNVIILNEAYVDVLKEQEQYESFADRTRMIYSYEIIEENMPKEEEPDQQEENLGSISERPFVVFVSGNDTRSNSLQTGHSDLNILVIVNPTTHQILMVNTPRDFYVPTSRSAIGERDKLTHCGMYGIDCSMDTLAALYDLDVDYYAQVNFTGFEKLIDDIGGITVDVDQSFTSRFGYRFNKGEQHLSGEYALALARERRSFATGDYKRGENQMKILQAIIYKLMNEETILTHYSDILSDLEGMFATNLTHDELSELVKFQLENRISWRIKSTSVIGTGASMTTYTMPNQRAYVMIPDDAVVEHVKGLIQKVWNGGILIDKDMEMKR